MPLPGLLHYTASTRISIPVPPSLLKSFTNIYFSIFSNEVVTIDTLDDNPNDMNKENDFQGSKYFKPKRGKENFKELDDEEKPLSALKKKKRKNGSSTAR